MSTADESLKFAGFFEAEVLVELMLRFWQHPFADDKDFRCSLLEASADALYAAAKGEQLIEDLPAEDTSLVAAIWYAEWTTLSAAPPDPRDKSYLQRQQWLEAVRRALPSCFCDSDLLE